MLCLPQPFANCYILLFFLLRGGEKWVIGGEMVAGCTAQLASLPSVPVCPRIYRPSVAVSSRVEEHAGFTQRFKLSLWQPIMSPLFAALHIVMQTEAAIVFQRSGTVRSADGSVLGRDGTGVEWGVEVKGEWRKTSLTYKNHHSLNTANLSSTVQGKTASRSRCSEITGDGCFQYLPLQKEICQRGKKKKSLRSNNEFTINRWAKNMLWSVCARSSCCDLSFITEVAVLQPCPCYCTLSCCWLNKLLLDVWGPTPAINLFAFN